MHFFLVLLKKIHSVTQRETIDGVTEHGMITEAEKEASRF